MGYDPQVLERGRALAETTLTETITAGDYADTTDPATLKAVRTLVTSRYTGPARVKYPSAAVSEASGPGTTVAEQSVIVSLATSAARLHVGDEIEVTASTADGSLVGRRFRVTGSPQSGQVTLHRYPVEEET